jgi:hypothetical protein
MLQHFFLHTYSSKAVQPVTIGLYNEFLAWHEEMHNLGQWADACIFWSYVTRYFQTVILWTTYFITIIFLHCDHERNQLKVGKYI